MTNYKAEPSTEFPRPWRTGPRQWLLESTRPVLSPLLPTDISGGFAQERQRLAAGLLIFVGDKDLLWDPIPHMIARDLVSPTNQGVIQGH
jgi:hypothetical protein